MDLIEQKKNLAIFLCLIAIHSFIVGLGLIISPNEFFESLGYKTVTERFFPTQGGVFHVIMSICYLMAADKLEKSFDLLVFSIIVKLAATLFLIIYYAFVLSELIILLSAIGDGIMGLILWWLFSSYNEKVFQ